MQLVEPHIHRVNAAERAIHTFKNNFIAGLGIGNENFTTILWYYLISQYQYSLNILNISRVQPQLSEYQVLEGTHDLNIHPWYLPSTRATIFNTQEIRSSWGDRALEAWYIGPAWDHCRCLKSRYRPQVGSVSPDSTHYTHNTVMYLLKHQRMKPRG